MDLKQLTEEINYQWKIQSITKDNTKASCAAYIDARDVMRLLDHVVGPDKWKDEYKEINGQMFCGLSIKIGDEWVTKWDTGVKGDYEQEKSQVSDSFKRAAVKWGIGRFLYDLEIKWLKVNQYKKPLDDSGNVIYDLTAYLNDQKSKTSSYTTQTIKTFVKPFQSSTVSPNELPFGPGSVEICKVCNSELSPGKFGDPYCRTCWLKKNKK